MEVCQSTSLAPATDVKHHILGCHIHITEGTCQLVLLRLLSAFNHFLAAVEQKMYQCCYTVLSCLFMKVINMEPCQPYPLNLWREDLLWHRLLKLYGEKLFPRRLICCFMKSILSPHHIQFIFFPPLWFCSGVGITEPSTHVDHSPQCKLVPVRTDCRIDVT